MFGWWNSEKNKNGGKKSFQFIWFGGSEGGWKKEWVKFPPELPKSILPKLEGKVCEKLFITENLLFCPFWLQHFLISTKKKKKSYNISIVINYCNKNIPQNLFKSQFLFFQLSISFIKYTRGITKYFLSFYFFYTSYIIYCISLCCPWLVLVVLLDMLGVIKFSR